MYCFMIAPAWSFVYFSDLMYLSKINSMYEVSMCYVNEKKFERGAKCNFLEVPKPKIFLFQQTMLANVI